METRSMSRESQQTTQNKSMQSKIDAPRLEKPRRAVKPNKNKDQLHDQERLKKKREAERARRQRIRENPEHHEQYCQKERERNQRRKQDGKILTINQLSEREKRIRRQKQNERKRKSRIQQKLPSSSLHIDLNENNVVLKQARLGKKRIAKNFKKCYRDNEKLKAENLNLKKSVNTLRKRIARAKLKKPKSTSPNSKVNKFLKKRQVDNDIRQRLITSEILMQQMKATYRDLTSDKSKQILGRVLCGKVIKKYRNLTRIKKLIAPVVTSRIRQDGDPLKEVRKEKAGVNFLRNKIKCFYEENSQIDPGKKSTQ